MARPLDFQFGGSEQDKNLLARNKTRASVFEYFLAHLRRHPKCRDLEVFTDAQPEYQFLQATGAIEIQAGDKREERTAFHFGRIDQWSKEKIQLDASTVSKDGLESAALYKFAIPVFPQSTRKSVAAALNGSGVSCEDLQEWLGSTDITEDARHYGHSPKLAVICPHVLVDDRHQPRPDSLTNQECFELGFLLSSCGVIVLYGEGGNGALRDYLRSKWSTWYEKWVEERTLIKRMQFVEASTENDLKRMLKELLSYRHLQEALASAQKDFKTEE